MNDRTMYAGVLFVIGMVGPQLLPSVRGYGERPPLVPSIMIGITVGAIGWLVFPLIFG